MIMVCGAGIPDVPGRPPPAAPGAGECHGGVGATEPGDIWLEPGNGQGPIRWYLLEFEAPLIEWVSPEIHCCT